MAYGRKYDKVIYSKWTSDFTEDDWIYLAFAALDQAGITRNQGRRIAEILGRQSEFGKEEVEIIDDIEGEDL
jgi:hypothetical protein